jgi:hypothetical protein
MFTLKIEADAGSIIDNAVIESKQLACRLGVSVEFVFNGVTMYATPNIKSSTSTDNAILQYKEKVSDKSEFKFIVY